MLNILFTTDNHIGVNELDPVRSQDAINTFQEAFSIAVERKCDFVLQGGDLFHLNKPSKKSMFDVIKVLRTNCFGDKDIDFEILNHGDLMPPSSASLNVINFEDPNFNVSLPVFAISGNHDDCGGSQNRFDLLSPLDLLAASGLINHFGRVYDNTEIKLVPILFQKDNIKVALYGMANVKDERLYRTWEAKNVVFVRPKVDPDSYFNIFMVHQNHNKFGPKNYLPEQFIPNFIDLVLWGHEHESVDLTYNALKQFHVCQPGSTVATSLSPSELGRRYCLQIKIEEGKKASFDQVYLNTVRPFKFKSIKLSEDAKEIKPMTANTRQQVTEFLIDEVNSLISEVSQEYDEKGVPEDQRMLPLVRLRVDYSGGYELENITRFSNRFLGKVANSNDVLILAKQRVSAGPALKVSETELTHFNEDRSAQLVPVLMSQALEKMDMDVLEQKQMVDALKRYVEKDERHAIKDQVEELVNTQIENVSKMLEQMEVPSKRPNDGTSASNGKKPRTEALFVDESQDEETPNFTSTPTVPQFVSFGDPNENMFSQSD